jgi:hypothetical protein
MTNQKTSKTGNMILPEDSSVVEGVDAPFGPPPEEYNYRCSQCRYEMEVNEAIIDVEVGMAKFDGSYHEGFWPILGCPNCNRETMEYAGD